MTTTFVCGRCGYRVMVPDADGARILHDITPDDLRAEVIRLNALLTRLQKQVRTDSLVNRYRVLCRDIRDAHRGKGKWMLDDYVDRFDRMYETIGETEEHTT